MNYFLHVNSYKHGDGANLWGYICQVQTRSETVIVDLCMVIELLNCIIITLQFLLSSLYIWRKIVLMSSSQNGVF